MRKGVVREKPDLGSVEERCSGGGKTSEQPEEHG